MLVRVHFSNVWEEVTTLRECQNSLRFVAFLINNLVLCWYIIGNINGNSDSVEYVDLPPSHDTGSEFVL